MSTRNHIGKSLFFSATLPATNDAAGFEALTWTELEYTQSLPQFGVTHANIDVPDLKSGFTSGVKGAASGDNTTGSCRIVDSALTTAQAAFKAICESAGGNIALKIGTGSGTANALVATDPVSYAQGYVHSYKPVQATDSAHEGFTYGFKQNAPTVDDEEPA